MYRAWEEPPTFDHRPSLCAWLIETALVLHQEAYQYEEPFRGQLWNRADATVQVVTGMDREAAHRALLYLDELQDGISEAVYGAPEKIAIAVYEEALVVLGSKGKVAA